MTRRAVFAPALAAALALGAPAAAAAQVVVDSVTLAVDTRDLWRFLDRGDGPALRGGVSLGLLGYAVNQSTGPDGRYNLTFDALGWVAPARRATRDVYDQAQGRLTLGWCLALCRYPSWQQRTVLALSASGYALPNAPGDAFTPEVAAELRSLVAVPRIGGWQFGGKFFPTLTVARDLRRYDATYAHLGVGTSVGPAAGLTGSLVTGVALSDFPGRGGAARSFGYQAAYATLGVDRDFAISLNHLDVAVEWTLATRPPAAGADVGALTFRVRWY